MSLDWVHGGGLSTPVLKPFSLLGFDFASKTLTIDLDFEFEESVERPFSLNLEDLGLPEAFSSLVAADAGGNLSADVMVALSLGLGLDLAVRVDRTIF